MYLDTFLTKPKLKDRVKIKYDCCGQESEMDWLSAEKNLKVNNGKHICRSCRCKSENSHIKKLRKLPEEFVKQAIEKWGHLDRYDYTNTVYKTKQIKIIFRCKVHGIIEQMPANHLKNGCQFCNKRGPSKYTIESFIIKANEVHNNRYTYENIKELKSVHDKIPITCKIHGVFNQTACFHIQGKGGDCPGCVGGVRDSKEEFIKKAIEKHGDKFNYSLVEYINSHKKITIMCPEHGPFSQRPYSHQQNVHSCPDCANKQASSVAEKEISDYISSLYKGEILLNKRSFLEGRKEIDIFLPEFSLGIEFNGNYWHTERVRAKNYHYEKYKMAKEKGIYLIQIASNEWEDKKQIVLSKLSSLVNCNKKIYARQTKVEKLNYIDKNNFLDRTHLQGKDNSSYSLGLIYKGDIVACMTFGVSRYDKKYDWELMRYSSELYTNVIGGASKLLSHFTGKGKMISYADSRWSYGKMYEKLGFQFDGETSVDYKYYHTSNKTLHNRQKFQKHKLVSMPFYDEKLTEEEIMELNGYEKIFGAGNTRWIKEF